MDIVGGVVDSEDFCRIHTVVNDVNRCSVGIRKVLLVTIIWAVEKAAEKMVFEARDKVLHSQ